MVVPEQTVPGVTLELCLPFGQHFFNAITSKGLRSHFPLPSCSSKLMCSNWNTIENSLPSGLLYSLAISGVAPHVSPTVSKSSAF